MSLGRLYSKLCERKYFTAAVLHLSSHTGLMQVEMGHAMHPVLTSTLSATNTELVSKRPALTIITQMEHL